jgi:hypothetical protein
MRPVVVSVGPLVTAAANNISTSQTPAVTNGQLALNGTLTSAGFVGTGSISSTILTITAVSSGVISLGQAVSGAGVLNGATVIGNLTGTGGAGTYLLSTSQTLSSTTIYGNAIATLDTARRVLFTTVSDESAKTIYITGTNWAGDTISESLTGPAATTGYTALDYKTVTKIYVSAAFTGAVTVGTNTIASSPWVRMDEYALAQSAMQATVSGTVNYTVQTSMDDTNSPTNPVLPASVTWVSSTDTNVVGATATKSTTFTATPLFIRVLLNSGSGSVTSTVVQAGVAPY